MKNYTVGIIVTSGHNEKIFALADNFHIWVIKTPDYQTIADEFWKFNKETSLNKGITTFNFSPDDSAEKVCLEILNTIDEHHYGWNEVITIGVELSNAIKKGLKSIGFSNFQEIDDGFKGHK